MATAIQSPVIPFTFEEEGHRYLDEAKRPILSVTQVLDSVGIVDYSGAPEEAMAFKRDIGTAVDSAVHALSTPEAGELDWDTVDHRCVGYVTAFERFISEAQWVCQHSKYRNCVKLPQGNVGFEVDQVGTMAGLSVILDVKCTSQEMASWRVQLAGYEECLLAMGFTPQGARVFQRVALQLKPDGSFKVYPYTDRIDKNVWQWALALATWKINDGGYKLL